MVKNLLVMGLSVEVDTGSISGTLQFNPAEDGAVETGVAQGGYGQDTLADANSSRRIAIEDAGGGITASAWRRCSG